MTEVEKEKGEIESINKNIDNLNKLKEDQYIMMKSSIENIIKIMDEVDVSTENNIKMYQISLPIYRTYSEY